MNKAPILSVRGLTRTYPTAQGGLTVLKGVDLDVFPGELVGLIGPSGSGKSSLLHAAGLLEKPTAGAVTIDGEAVGDLDEVGTATPLLDWCSLHHEIQYTRLFRS